MGGDPIPGPLDRIRERSFSYYREMEALMKEYDLDVQIRVAVIDSGAKKGWGSGPVVSKTEFKTRAGEFNNYELLIRWGACYTFS